MCKWTLIAAASVMAVLPATESIGLLLLAGIGIYCAWRWLAGRREQEDA